MKAKYKFNILILCVIAASCSLSLSCNVKSNVSNQKGCQYGPLAQDFKTDVAWIVMEWNCKPSGYGSGFLVDRERGAFYTNKHVSNQFDAYGKGSHKIFFNGKVYNVEIVKVSPLSDAALIRITDDFDPLEFPEPAPFAQQKSKEGDDVFIGGFHPHPYSLIEANKTEGYDERLVPIYGEYYNMGTRQLDKRQEVVFESMRGKVTGIDMTWEDIMKRRRKYESAEGFTESLGNKINFFHEIRVFKDHKFSFGGLSGSPSRNAKGEITGITTRQNTERFEYDKEELERKGSVSAKHVWDDVYITPIEAVADLVQYLDRKQPR